MPRSAERADDEWHDGWDAGIGGDVEDERGRREERGGRRRESTWVRIANRDRGDAAVHLLGWDHSLAIAAMPAFNWTTSAKKRSVNPPPRGGQSAPQAFQSKPAGRLASSGATPAAPKASRSHDLVVLSSRTLDPARGQAPASAPAMPPAETFRQPTPQHSPMVEEAAFAFAPHHGMQSHAGRRQPALLALRDSPEYAGAWDVGSTTSGLDTASLHGDPTPTLLSLRQQPVYQLGSRLGSPAYGALAGFSLRDSGGGGMENWLRSPQAPSPLHHSHASRTPWLDQAPSPVPLFPRPSHRPPSPPPTLTTVRAGAGMASGAPHPLGVGDARPGTLKRSLESLGFDLMPIEPAPMLRQCSSPHHAAAAAAATRTPASEDLYPEVGSGLGMLAPRPRPPPPLSSSDAFASGFLLDALRPQTRPPRGALRSEATSQYTSSARLDDEPTHAMERPVDEPWRGQSAGAIAEADVRVGGSSVRVDGPTVSPFFAAASAGVSGTAAGGGRSAGGMARGGMLDDAEGESPLIHTLGRCHEATERAPAEPAARAPASSTLAQPTAPPPSPLPEAHQADSALAPSAPAAPRAMTPAPAAPASARSVRSRASSDSGVAADDAPLQLAREEYICAEYGSMSTVMRGSEAASTRVGEGPPAAAPAPRPTMRDQLTQTRPTMGVDAATQTDG